MTIPATRVLIVDDSPVFAGALRHVLEGDSRLSVVGHAGDGREALELVRGLHPDVVTMDLHMPRLSGIEAIGEIMATKPTPILVMTADPRAEEHGLCFDALSRGALDLIPKPSMNDARARSALCDRVHLLSTVSVVPHGRRKANSAPVVVNGTSHHRSATVLGIVASAGGPSALAHIVARLPRELPFGVVIVQHLYPGFTEHLVGWLGGAATLPVRLCTDDAVVAPGTVWLAPDDRHVRVSATRRLILDDSGPIGGHRPSGDVLLSSIAASLGSTGMGLVLTGMGRDGASGLLALKEAGGATFAQDGASSAVDGMPRAARELGAAQYVCALDDIAPALMSGALKRERKHPS